MSATQKRVRLSNKWHSKVHLSANCLKASYNEVFQWVCMMSWLSPRGLRSLALKKRLRRRLIRVSIRNNGYCFPSMCISLLISSFQFCHFRKGEKRNYVRKKLSENVRLHSGILSPSLSYRMQNSLLNYNKLAYDQSSSRKTKHKYLLMLLICRIS